VLPGLVRHHRHQTHPYFTEISFFVLNRILTKSPTQRTSGSEQTQQERTSGNMSWSARDVVDRERIALFFNGHVFHNTNYAISFIGILMKRHLTEKIST